jgi:hypothetical protein
MLKDVVGHPTTIIITLTRVGVLSLGGLFGVLGLGVLFGILGLGVLFGVLGLGVWFGVPGLGVWFGVLGMGVWFGVLRFLRYSRCCGWGWSRTRGRLRSCSHRNGSRSGRWGE